MATKRSTHKRFEDGFRAVHQNTPRTRFQADEDGVFIPTEEDMDILEGRQPSPTSGEPDGNLDDIL